MIYKERKEKIKDSIVIEQLINNIYKTPRKETRLTKCG